MSGLRLILISGPRDYSRIGVTRLDCLAEEQTINLHRVCLTAYPWPHPNRTASFAPWFQCETSYSPRRQHALGRCCRAVPVRSTRHITLITYKTHALTGNVLYPQRRSTERRFAELRRRNMQPGTSRWSALRDSLP